MDLLKLGSEMIRNEALLLLIEISKTNVELQKVIAYESGFENLLTIIESEGLSNGGIVVQDCLSLINNLLSGNTSNQNHFREMGCIKRLVEILKLDASDYWTMSDDKKDNILLTLTAISALLSSPSSVQISADLVNSSLATQPPSAPPSSSTSSSSVTSQPKIVTPSSLIKPTSSIQSTQTHFSACPGLSRVIELALSAIKAPAIRIKALWVLGDLIFCHTNNTTFLEQHDFKASHGPGRISALLKITQTLFFSKVPMESLAALHVLKCYFHENPAAQRLFAATITSPHHAPGHTAHSHTVPTLAQLAEESYPARIMVGYLLSWESHKDFVKTFYAAMSLSYILNGNTGVKEQLLKIPFEQVIPNVPIENLLSKLVKWLLQAIQINAELPVLVAFFRCLAAWIEDCPLAANHFRANSANVAFLANMINSSATTVHIAGLAAHLYGLALDPTAPAAAEALEKTSTFLSRLEMLRKTPEFVSAERGGPHAIEAESNLPFYDSSFALSYLKQMAQILFNTSNTKTLGTPVSIPQTTAPHASAQLPPQAAATHVVHSAPMTANILQPISGEKPLFEPIPPKSAPPAGLVANPPTTGATGANVQTFTQKPSTAVNGNGHANGTHHHHAENGPVKSNNAHIHPEMEEMKRQLAILQQEKQAWFQEKKALETQLHTAHSHINHLQAQLQASTRQNQEMSLQLQTSASGQLSATGDSNKYETLKMEYEELNAAHEDLLVLLGETQDELDMIKSNLPQQHRDGSEDLL